MLDIFTYMNYRDIIRDYHKSQKLATKTFSYQVFAERAGFSTKTYLIEIVSGKKKLSKKSLFNVTKAMKFNEKETQFFETLVNFNHAKQLKEKELYFERVKALAGKSVAKIIDSSFYGFFSQWYHMVVRELITMDDFKGDLKWVAKKIRPRVTLKNVKESVELLLSLKMVTRLPSNRFALTNPSITTGDELHSLAVTQYQQKAISLAAEAIERFPLKQRDISTLSGGVSQECFLTLKKEIQIFRKYLQGIMDKDTGQDRVYQVNFQLFPLTEIPKNE